MIYSDLKAVWHTGKIELLRQRRRPAPAQVQIVLSDLCQQNCNFCAYRADAGLNSAGFRDGENKNPNRMIPTEKVYEILEDCYDLGVKAVQFTGGGEPTLHKDHIQIFEYASMLGLKMGLVTNGLLLSDAAVYDHFEWVRVSIDAGNEKDYETIRGTKSWRKAWKNASNINGFKGIGFVITRDNFKGVLAAALLSRAYGADYIRFSAVFSTEGDFYGDIEEDIVEQIKYARRYETDNFAIYDLFTDRRNDLNQGSPDYSFCGYQFFNVYIGGNQKIYRCCTTAYQQEVGDLSKMSFKEWFESSDRKYFGFDAKDCSVCQFNNKNRNINYMLSAPQHIEFV